MVFTSEAQIEAAMRSACTVAIDNTCTELWKELQSLIDTEYYQAYTPKKYERTFQFYNSALHDMINDLCGEIFMEAGFMNYSGQDPVWTGEQQLIGAEAGYHGQLAIRGGGGFWSKFLAYFDANALPMLKRELQAQGVPVQ